MKDSQRMVGALCEGCGVGSNSKLGKVTQRDSGSADKWHARCYREARAIDPVEIISRHRAYCGRCDWFGHFRNAIEDARIDAALHRAEHR